MVFEFQMKNIPEGNMDYGQVVFEFQMKDVPEDS